MRPAPGVEPSHPSPQERNFASLALPGEPKSWAESVLSARSDAARSLQKFEAKPAKRRC